MDARSSRYHEVYARWQRDPHGLLGRGGRRYRLVRKAQDHVRSEGRHLWPLVPGRRLNTCYNAVDRHVNAGRGDQAAMIYDSPLAGTQRTIPITAC